MTNNIEMEKNRNQLIKIEEAIQKAITNGQYLTSINYWPSKTIQTFIKDKGYKIETFTYRNESWTQINWAQGKIK